MREDLFGWGPKLGSSIVDPEDHVRRSVHYCYDDRCPILERHNVHDVEATIDACVLEVVPDGTITLVSKIIDACADLADVDVFESLKRLVRRGQLRKIGANRTGLYFYTPTMTPYAAQAAYAVAPAPGVAYKTVVLDHCVIAACSSRQVRTAWQIHRLVVEDYGEVTPRTVYRSLARLVSTGRLAHVGPDGAGGYLLPDSPLVQDRSAVEDQLLIAYLERADAC